MHSHVNILAILAACATTATAQQLPGTPEENGLTPKTGTIYVNSQADDSTIINNGKTESVGVAIANSGNVMVGWEDDAADSEATPLLDLEAVWTLFDSSGGSITPLTGVNTLAFPTSEVLSNKFLSYFRADQSAVFGGSGWGPKIKANLFGDGIGMGSSSFFLGEEVVAFAAYDDQNSGDFPSVQLLGNEGAPVGILAGVTAAYATRDSGSIRIGDWDYLSNGNLVIAGESRQSDDLVSVYGGDAAETHAIYRLVSASGNVIKAETLASDTPTKSEMWHGIATVKDGFAIRFLANGGAKVRLFDNSGNPTSTNIDIAALAGLPVAGGTDRGDSSGFHSNGKDAYVLANVGADPTNSTPAVWLTVLNTNGTVRFTRSVADDLTLATADRADAAIETNGQVVVIFSGKYDASYEAAIMGRRFDATGKPIGGTFYISEKEAPASGAYPATNPRVTWRNGQVAVAWVSKNDAGTLNSNGENSPVAALRLFSTFDVGSIESAGLTRIVPDKALLIPDYDALGNWEPYASTLGTSTFVIEGSTFADGSSDMQRNVVALQPTDGSTGVLVEGFYADDGTPYKGAINASRQNGNPGRVAGDTRPGAVNYMVGAEASPHTINPQFTSDNRWTLGFDRLSDGRYGTIQAYQLSLSSLTPTPLMKAVDSANGRLTSGTAAGNQITRFGGDIVCLDNGNFASVVEDRSRVRDADNDLVVATIFAPNGTVVKDSFVVSKSDIWANVAPFKGGFAVRAKPEDGSATRVIYCYDNAGTLLGVVDQAASGASFDTGRGDGTRLFGHINSPYVYLTGRAANTEIVKVAAFNATNQQFVAIADVNEGAFTGNFDRAFGAVDALNRLTVAWVSQPSGYTNSQVAARVFEFDGVNKKFTALTRSFFAFVNVNATNSIHSLSMSVAMTTKQICVAAKGEINRQNKPELGADTPKEVNFYTVFSHPAPKADPTTPVGGATTGPTLKIAIAGATATLSWDASTTGYTLESKEKLTDAAWTTVGTQNPTTQAIGSSKFYRLRK
jgi:hypothetical protein